MLDDEDFYNAYNPYEADYNEMMLDELTGTTAEERNPEFWRRIDDELAALLEPLPCVTNKIP